MINYTLIYSELFNPYANNCNILISCLLTGFLSVLLKKSVNIFYSICLNN